MTSVFFRRQYEVLPGYYRPDTETSKTDNRKRLQIKKRFSKTQAIKEGFMLSALVPQPDTGGVTSHAANIPMPPRDQ
jgi:hypothetical protein